MQPKLNWQAFSGDDRNKIIAEIKECILGNDAYIVNFNLFSDYALSLSIEVSENRILPLYQSLAKIATISEFDAESLSKHSKKGMAGIFKCILHQCPRKAKINNS